MDEIHLSIEFAKNLTFPELVTLDNIEHLSKCVDNGHDVYPGANSVIQGNNVIYLHETTEKIKLNVGDTVDRHITNKDICYKNRDPNKSITCSRDSYSIVIDPKTKNSKLVYYFHQPYFNADFDGDEMNGRDPKRKLYKCNENTKL